jgi:beta-glucosidase
VDLAREAAEKSMVLLKNEGPVLPLARSSVRTVAVMGRLADGAENMGDHGSSRVYPPTFVSPLSGLREYLGPGARLVHDLGTDPSRVRQLAREVDALVIVAGLDQRDEGEWIPENPEGDRGGDRRRLGLHEDEIQLIHGASALNPRTVVVLVGGGPLTMEEWRYEAPAILLAFYPGMEGGRALARVLFGDVSPSGKLPYTIPGDVSWLPPFDPKAQTVDYGYYHGYALAEKKGIEPALAFGFGLSYTRFSYGQLRLSQTAIPMDGSLDVEVEVTNVGSRSGEEVAQLYAGFPGSRIDRPRKLLRGFEKIALDKGQTKTVRFTLRARDLAYWDAAAGRFQVDPGAYEVLVGGSSRKEDLLLAGFRVEAAP